MHYATAIFDVIISDDDSTMKAVLKHPSIGVRGKVIKSSKGKLDKEIPVPSFLNYPSHCIKVVAKHIFYVVNDGKVQ